MALISPFSPLPTIIPDDSQSPVQPSTPTEIFATKLSAVTRLFWLGKSARWTAAFAYNLAYTASVPSVLDPNIVVAGTWVAGTGTTMIGDYLGATATTPPQRCGSLGDYTKWGYVPNSGNLTALDSGTLVKTWPGGSSTTPFSNPSGWTLPNPLAFQYPIVGIQAPFQFAITTKRGADYLLKSAAVFLMNSTGFEPIELLTGSSHQAHPNAVSQVTISTPDFNWVMPLFYEVPTSPFGTFATSITGAASVEFDFYDV